jgi:glycosyltransferase involved in cell wall biosynthesis
MTIRQGEVYPTIGIEQKGPPPTVRPTETKWRVLIAHPGRQHSHQAALALLEAGYLDCYATGIPVSKDQVGRAGQPLLRKFSLYDEIDIPVHLAKLNMIVPITNRLLVRYLPEHFGGPLLYESHRMFDRWVAKLIEQRPIDAVIAYENSAVHTFEAAKRSGVTCILDAASLHGLEADRLLKDGLPQGYKAGVNRRKDMEVALADCIITASELAAASYRSHVGPNVKVKAITLGVDIERFTPSSRWNGRHLERDPFTFIFVGTAGRRKGFDILLEALKRLLVEGLRVRLLVAGHIDQSILAGRSELLEVISAVGRVGQGELASVLGSAHCLVLPSRFDSFGMVVPEAMACGLPVIVTEMVGAKQLVQEGQNGFIVPVEDVPALAARMRWLIQNRMLLPRMSSAARAAAEQATWAIYRRRFGFAIREAVLDR